MVKITPRVAPPLEVGGAVGRSRDTQKTPWGVVGRSRDTRVAGHRRQACARRGQAHRASRHEVALHPSAPGGADEGADLELARAPRIIAPGGRGALSSPPEDAERANSGFVCPGRPEWPGGGRREEGGGRRELVLVLLLLLLLLLPPPP